MSKRREQRISWSTCSGCGGRGRRYRKVVMEGVEGEIDVGPCENCGGAGKVGEGEFKK